MKWNIYIKVCWKELWHHIKVCVENSVEKNCDARDWIIKIEFLIPTVEYSVANATAKYKNERYRILPTSWNLQCNVYDATKCPEEAIKVQHKLLLATSKLKSLNNKEVKKFKSKSAAKKWK